MAAKHIAKCDKYAFGNNKFYDRSRRRKYISHTAPESGAGTKAWRRESVGGITPYPYKYKLAYFAAPVRRQLQFLSATNCN